MRTSAAHAACDATCDLTHLDVVRDIGDLARAARAESDDSESQSENDMSAVDFESKIDVMLARQHAHTDDSLWITKLRDGPDTMMNQTHLSATNSGEWKDCATRRLAKA